MKIWVNDQPVELVAGMTVRHALIQLDLLEAVEKGQQVIDEWGNRVGLDGAVAEGQRFEVR
jgi:sulfur carrier protein ThiS